MNEQNISEQALGTVLTEGELSLVIGGSGDTTDPVGTATGATVESGKATPILF